MNEEISLLEEISSGICALVQLQENERKMAEKRDMQWQKITDLLTRLVIKESKNE